MPEVRHEALLCTPRAPICALGKHLIVTSHFAEQRLIGLTISVFVTVAHHCDNGKSALQVYALSAFALCVRSRKCSECLISQNCWKSLQAKVFLRPLIGMPLATYPVLHSQTTYHMHVEHRVKVHVLGCMREFIFRP